MTTATKCVYDATLQLYRIFAPSGIQEDKIRVIKNKGWTLYLDGYGGIHGLLDAPQEAYDEIIQLFKI